MKKILSSVLCLAMVLSMGITAFAADINSTILTYVNEASYEIVIPAEATVNASTGKGTLVLNITDTNLADDQTVSVSVASSNCVDNSWYLVNTKDASDKIAYAIGTTNGGRDVISGEEIVSAKEVGSFTLYIELIDDARVGSFTDTLTFTSEIVDSEASGVTIETTSTYLRPIFSEEEGMIYVYLTDEGINAFNSIDWVAGGGYTNYVMQGSDYCSSDIWFDVMGEIFTAGDFLVAFEYNGPGTYEVYLTEFVDASIIITGGLESSFNISFSVDGINYFAKEEMTWGEWLSSSYVAEGFYFGDEYPVMYQTDGPPYIVLGEAGPVSLEESIDKNIAYTLEYYDESADIPQGNYFIFDGEAYSFDYGMTIGDWFRSYYNTSSIGLNPNDEFYNKTTGQTIGGTLFSPEGPSSLDREIDYGEDWYIEYDGTIELPYFVFGNSYGGNYTAESYKYEIGMTLKEWLKSDYNTSDIKLNNSDEFYYEPTGEILYGTIIGPWEEDILTTGPCGIDIVIFSSGTWYLDLG